jgi:hypothetical protein
MLALGHRRPRRVVEPEREGSVLLSKEPPSDELFSDELPSEERLDSGSDTTGSPRMAGGWRMQSRSYYQVRFRAVG